MWLACAILGTKIQVKVAGLESGWTSVRVFLVIVIIIADKQARISIYVVSYNFSYFSEAATGKYRSKSRLNYLCDDTTWFCLHACMHFDWFAIWNSSRFDLWLLRIVKSQRTARLKYQNCWHSAVSYGFTMPNKSSFNAHRTCILWTAAVHDVMVAAVIFLFQLILNVRNNWYLHLAIWDLTTTLPWVSYLHVERLVKSIFQRRIGDMMLRHTSARWRVLTVSLRWRWVRPVDQLYPSLLGLPLSTSHSRNNSLLSFSRCSPSAVRVYCMALHV